MSPRRVAVRWGFVGILLLASASTVVTPPWTLPPAGGPPPVAPDPWRGTGRPVALLLADGVPHDAAWIDRLRMHFGAIDVMPAGAAPDAIDGPALMLLGHDTLRRLDPAWEAPLRRYVRDGGILVVEAPDTTWTRLAGVRLATVEREDSLPWPIDPPLSDPLAPGRLAPPPIPLPIPLTTWRYAPGADRANSAEIRTRIGGRPALWGRTLGSGEVVTVSHGLGRLVDDFVAAPPSPPPDSPWLDVWTGAVLAPDGLPAPWARWSMAPPGSDGWILVGGDAEAPATRFVPAPLPASPGNAIAGVWPGALDPGRAEAELRGIRRLGPFRLGRTVVPLSEQLRGAAAPRVHRFRADAAPREWTPEVWAAVVDAGVALDASRGPVSGGGFVFGTAGPLRTADVGGRPWPIVALPHVLRDTVVEPAEISAWIEANATAAAGPLVLHVDDAGAIASALEFARARNVRTATFTEFLEWWQRRDAATLRSRFDAGELHVDVDGRNLAPTGGALLLPRRWRGTALVDWNADWSPASARVVERAGTEYLEVGVPTGTRGSLRAVFRSP